MIKKSEKSYNKKNANITKLKHAFEGFTSTYNIDVLNSFNPELQLKDTQSAIKSY